MSHLANSRIHNIATLNLASNGILISTDGTTITCQSGSTLRTSLGLGIGTDVQAYSAELASVAGLSSTGIAVRTNTNSWAVRQITGTTNRITVTAGDGVAGDITLNTPQDIHTGATPTFAGLTVSGSVSIDGNLTVTGATNTINTTSENILIGDNFTVHNSGYSADSAQTAGFVMVYDPTSTQTTVNGNYTSGSNGVSNPTIVTTGSGTFAQHDIIQISGSTNNDGLYEVHGHSGTTLTLRSTSEGVTDRVEDFTSDRIVGGSSDGATITKVTVSVLRTNTSGDWQTAKGSTTPLSYSSLTTGAATTTITSIDNGDSPYTVQSGDQIILVDPTAGNTTVNLPAAASSSGRQLTIKHDSNSTNTVTIEGNSSEEIDGNLSIILGTRASVTLVCDGTHWSII